MEDDVWDKNIGGFERHPKIEDEMKTPGESKTFTFKNDGKLVGKETIQKALERKGFDNITAQDSLVFNLEDGEGRMWEHWKKLTCFNDLNKLKAIRAANNENLGGVRIKITRVAVGDKNRSNWDYEEDMEKAKT